MQGKWKQHFTISKRHLSLEVNSWTAEWTFVNKRNLSSVTTIFSHLAFLRTMCYTDLWFINQTHTLLIYSHVNTHSHSDLNAIVIFCLSVYSLFLKSTATMKSKRKRKVKIIEINLPRLRPQRCFRKTNLEFEN